VLPRILLRTHYQANEPRLIIAAATHSSSPVESRSEDAVASSLEKWARKNGYVISTPGAIYAVGNARHLGLLSNANRWTADGLAFAFLSYLLPPPPGLESRYLAPLEERLYLKIYLMGAGALLVQFAKWLIQRGSVTGEQLRTELVFEELLAQTLNEYLSLATDVRERAGIRKERERLNRIEYAASTQRHKRYPLLTTMERLRLLQCRDNGEATAVIQPDPDGRLLALSRSLPDIETLERLIRANELQEALDIQLREYGRHDLSVTEKPNALLLRAYTFAMETGMQACPLPFLDDILISAFPASPAARTPTAEQILEPIHRELSGQIRYHVNRRGQRAFVLIGKSAMERVVAG
jgi:hypothetical protein